MVVSDVDQMEKQIMEDFEKVMARDLRNGKDRNQLAWETKQRYKYYFEHQRKLERYQQAAKLREEKKKEKEKIEKAKRVPNVLW